MSSVSAQNSKWDIFTWQDAIRDVAVSESHLWCATYGGLISVDTNTHEIHRYTTLDGLRTNRIESVDVAYDGRILISYYSTKGFDLITLNPFEIEQLDEKIIHVWYLSANAIVTTSTEGLNFFNGTTWKLFSDIDGMAGSSIFWCEEFNGSIWVYGSGGLAHYNGMSWTRYPSDLQIEEWGTRLYMDIDGIIWALSSDGSIYRFDNADWILYANSGVNENYTQLSFAVDKRDDTPIIWVSLNVGIFNAGKVLKHNGTSWEDLSSEETKGVFRIYLSNEGKCYITVVNSAIQGLVEYSNGQWLPVDLGFIPARFYEIFFDNNILWGISDHNIFSYDGSSWNSRIQRDYYTIIPSTNQFGIDTSENVVVLLRDEVIRFSDSEAIILSGFAKYLPHEHINEFYMDSSDNLWFGTTGGVALYHDGMWTTLLKDIDIRSICEANDGAFYIGTYSNGIYRYFEGLIEQFATKSDLIVNQVLDIAFDSSDKMWVGTGAGISSYDGVNWRNYSYLDGLPEYYGFYDVKLDSLYTPWVSSAYNLHWLDGDVWEKISFPANDRIYFFTFDHNNTLWVIDQSYNLYTYQGTSSVIDNVVDDKPKAFLSSVINFPNPFNPHTTIQYELLGTGNVNISIFNSVGQEVHSHDAGQKESGIHQFEFDASSLATGVYIYKIEAENNHSSGKMMFIK
ncbi:two-component regulator propeller domain-containing protein [Candidatus Latescibacterota bacterium]